MGRLFNFDLEAKLQSCNPDPLPPSKGKRHQKIGRRVVGRKTLQQPILEYYLSLTLQIFQLVMPILFVVHFFGDMGDQRNSHYKGVVTENKMDIESNLKKYLHGDGNSGGIKPLERYCSFDYCFNYFQNFRERGVTRELSSEENIQQSCLQLGFYLASWGMLRGSSILLQKSAKVYEPTISAIANADAAIWEIDANSYDGMNIKKILQFEAILKGTLPASRSVPSATLVTKIMLGVFGNVPAFDTNFKNGFRTFTFGSSSLLRVRDFYLKNEEIIEKYRINTTDFHTGEPTTRKYTRAKVIDMCFFIEGGNKSLE